MASDAIKLLRHSDAKRSVYHLAAATVWGIIAALYLGVIEYDAPRGQFYVRENWFLATVGLSAIMYAALASLKKILPYRSADEPDTPGDE